MEKLFDFQFQRVLRHDTLSKSIAVLGTIDGRDAIITAEKTAYDVENVEGYFSEENITYRLIEQNDIYHLFVTDSLGSAQISKCTLIWPATKKHILKHMVQHGVSIRETPEMYRQVTLPFIEKALEESNLQWAYNILEKKAEVERIMYEDPDPKLGFVLLPDLKWDAKTSSTMYLQCLVHRNDIRTIRDLRKEDAPWLQHMFDVSCAEIQKKFGVPTNRLRVYVHYQPSYYHFHIHFTHMDYQGGGGQAIGRAILLTDVIDRLNDMHRLGCMQDVTLSYALGDEHELLKAFLASKFKDQIDV